MIRTTRTASCTRWSPGIRPAWRGHRSRYAAAASALRRRRPAAKRPSRHRYRAGRRSPAEVIPADAAGVRDGTADGFFDAHPDRRFDAVLFGDVLVNTSPTPARDAAALRGASRRRWHRRDRRCPALPTAASARCCSMDAATTRTTGCWIAPTCASPRDGMAGLMADGGLDITKLPGPSCRSRRPSANMECRAARVHRRSRGLVAATTRTCTCSQFVLVARPLRRPATHAELLALEPRRCRLETDRGSAAAKRPPRRCCSACASAGVHGAAAPE